MVILKHHIWIMIIGAVCLLAFFLGGLYALGWQYENSVLPGISVGSVPVGKMEKEFVRNFLEVMTDKLVNDGLQLNYQTVDGEKTLVIYPVRVVEGNPIELVHLDTETSADFLVHLGKTNYRLVNGWQVLRSYLCPQRIVLPGISVDVAQLSTTLVENLAQYETQPISASIRLKSKDLSAYEITPSRRGFVYNLSNLVKQITDSWSRLESTRLAVNLQETAPTVVESDVEMIVPRLSEELVSKIRLVYADPKNLSDRTWYLNEEKIRGWLEVQKTSEGKVVFGLNKDKVENYLKDVIATLVDIEPINAQFRMEGERVVEFQGSRPGMKLSLGATYEAINKIMWDRTLHDSSESKAVALVTEKTESSIKTGDVNSLGIKEVLGVGVSDYSNSPTNRIKNIANAVNKLNGILIKPGEEFSTLKYTRPFTYEGGYLPELVIKGDEIKPEIGGGLCQIATTLFRMSMNAGLQVDQRSNHSLVVSYYNDPANGNPGTDATIYDPAPDFRFRNDTNDYILVETLMDKDSEELVFTLWGTSDGRKAWYDHPQIIRWLPYGERKVVETTDLAPGEEKCQNAFRGADARFTYTKVLANGEKKEIVYESHYRPLPQICLVGVEAKEDAAGDCSNENAEECSEIVVEQADTESAEPLVENKNPA